MVKNIVRNQMFLKKKSTEAKKSDQKIAEDLMDTLLANRENCVGLAANMIGENKRIIVVSEGMMAFVMYNPVITSKDKEYITEEGCLSLDGVRICKRFEEIEVDYLDKNFEPKHRAFSGYIAQIVQHEMDHLEGILI